MRRITLLSVIATLVLSLAAPTGAAFALDEVADDSSQIIQTPEETIPEIEESPSEPEPIEVYPVVPTREDDMSTHKELSPLSADVLDEEESEEPPTAPPQPLPAIVIAQIQVGSLSSDGGANNEYVSIYNNSSELVDITGWCLRNKTRNFVCLDEENVDYSIEPGAYVGFSNIANRPGEHGVFITFAAGNHIVASSDTIQLVRGDEVIDAISWSSRPSSSPYAIERTWNLEVADRLKTGNDSWVWKGSLAIYGRILDVIECGGGVFVTEGEECPVFNTCKGVVISEIAANVDEQFIELHNPTNAAIDLTGCQVQTNRNTRSFVFSEVTLEANGFVVVLITDTELTLTKTTAGTVYVLSSDGYVEADSVSYRNLAKETSWALVSGKWVQTYNTTPGVANVHMQYLPCEEGYWRNLETGRCNRVMELAVLADCGEGRERNPITGRCRNIPTPRQLAPCKEGQYRSEETNRCRSIASAAARVLKPCAEGQFRNPATNRCKKIASTDDVALADCGEGRERNPATNRCRNVAVAGALTDTLPFPVEEVGDARESFAGWLTLGIVAIAGVGYGIWEWRYEIAGLSGRVFGKMKR